VTLYLGIHYFTLTIFEVRIFTTIIVSKCQTHST